MSDVMFMFAGDVAHHLDRGVALMKQNRFEDAIIEFDRVLELDPTERHARWDRVLARLSLGDYVNGMPEHDCAWALYDWRSLGPVEGNIDRLLTLPIWHGEYCKLIVYHEMGFGDAIMLLRFLPELVRRCTEVALIVRQELVGLFQGHGATILDHVPQDLSDFDARVTLFNSVHTMGHTLGTIPSKPYIKSDFRFSGGKMGIAWSGNSRKELDLTNFLLRLDIDGFDLYALQTGSTDYIPAFDRKIVPLKSSGFKETAELMRTLDHIVTVDTSAAHLAGAMGHPSVHLVLPYFRDWRWWHKDVWYPTINIYVQDRIGDWDAPFDRVNRAIHAKS